MDYNDGKPVEYFGEVVRIDGVRMPHGRGVMKNEATKTVTIGWWFLGKLAIAGQSNVNPKAKFIRLKTKDTYQEELLKYEFDGIDDLDDNIFSDDEDANFEEGSIV